MESCDASRFQDLDCWAFCFILANVFLICCPAVLKPSNAGPSKFCSWQDCERFLGPYEVFLANVEAVQTNKHNLTSVFIKLINKTF